MFTILFRVRFCIIYNLAKKSIIGCKKYIIRYLLHIVHIFIMSEDKAKLKALVAERGYIKGTLSRLNNFCHDADAMAATSREALREKRLRMSEAFQEYMQLNKAILVLADEDAENYGEYEDKYYESVGLLDKACSGPQTEAKPNGGENSNPEKRALALENTSEEKQPSFTAKSTRAPKVSGVAAAEKPQPACLAA
ncbi:uncharacterized protein LOC126373883 isoform X1 [Pectinophora gossypiella]|uniref:uncharacterized protein LOC126370887 n=3 Tax=Pectinophora gossypiella TaxID=13191 RepID=UPI00214E38DB|nr:uncharacterized protein LOC126370203 isoform X4 [Pectinophora gossypiella]XP_049871957.1 uncharacterized protein LOC126370887 [Pectinophora gossypiella]XP_049876193.1 uncharacterized protein LOC126373883 isoform X1 [Pectinophora gossypiella]